MSVDCSFLQLYCYCIFCIYFSHQITFLVELKYILLLLLIYYCYILANTAQYAIR